jgi:hypothetical protein
MSLAFKRNLKPHTKNVQTSNLLDGQTEHEFKTLNFVGNGLFTATKLNT